MRALRRTHDPEATVPFHSAQEAWFWTVAALLARRDGAGVAWRPDGPTRPCDPDDIVRCLDVLYRQRSIELLHASGQTTGSGIKRSASWNGRCGRAASSADA